MAYEHTVLQRAGARMARRREIRARKRWDLEQALYRQCPELRELDRALRGTMSELAGLAVSGAGIRADGPEITSIRARNLELQARRTEVLRELGHTPDELEDIPACPTCGDTGWVGDTMCPCMRNICRSEQMKLLTDLMNLTPEQCFNNLRLDVYSNAPWKGTGRSPREHMHKVAELCEGFACQFPNYPLKNLLLSGGTGLGKTFLSGCIAREVSERGFSVVYETAINLFAAFETRKFTRDAAEERQARDDTRRYLNCDLLILDDLGSEFISPMVQSALYEVINTRLQTGKSTIISTNLSTEQIAGRYNPQISSRIQGLYRELVFYGEDIRLRQL